MIRRLIHLLLCMAVVGLAWPATAETTVDVPVLVRALGQSDIIGEADIEWLALPFSKVPRNAITDMRDLIGMSPRRLVKPGTPVRDSDVVPPTLVSRNSVVLLVFASNNLTLTAKGKVLEDGALGDMVRVRNLQSEVVVEGLVQGDGTIAVGIY